MDEFDENSLNPPLEHMDSIENLEEYALGHLWIQSIMKIYSLHNLVSIFNISQALCDNL